MWRVAILGGLLALGLGDCERQKATAPPPLAEVTVSQPLVQEMTEALEYSGTTTAMESVEIRARVTGFLQEVRFRPRDLVNRGDKLFLIDERPFRNALDSATGAEAALQAQLVKAKSDLSKVQGLAERGQASQDELTTALATRDSLIGQIAQAQAQLHTAQLNLDFCTVTAPIHGRIGRNLVDPGNIVTADSTVLATLVNDDVIYAYFNASEQDVLMLRERVRSQQAARAGSPASQPEVEPLVYLGLMTEAGFPHEGRIDYIAPALDPSTGTIQIRARFDNAQRLLLPGLFVRLRVPISLPYQALTVVERALGSDQGLRYLLVVNAQNVVEYRPVQVGPLEGALRVITAGVQADDWVIVNGIQRVRPGSTVKPVSAPMPTLPATTRRGASPTTTPATRPAGQ
jgi:RND family efflux transporter MFP subunit